MTKVFPARESLASTIPNPVLHIKTYTDEYCHHNEADNVPIYAEPLYAQTKSLMSVSRNIYVGSPLTIPE